MATLIGTGSTFALTTGGAIGRIVSIGGFTEELADINDDDLATLGHMQYIAGGKIDHSELEIAIVFDPDDVQALGDTDTGTVTFPLPEGQSSPATLAGTGHFRGRGFDGLENDERIEGTVTWRFDGKDSPPAYTPSSA